jgi:hypothetical protein
MFMLSKRLNLRNITVLILIISFFGPRLIAQIKIPDDFCITSNELKLFNLINNYRKEYNLPEVSLSKNLCFVAKLHVNDLQTNRPDVGNCNLHSWSDQGIWTECCYGSESLNNTCMTSKPAELTTYNGKGYELAFWESLEAVPEIVLDSWLSSIVSKEMILNQGAWKNYNWKSLGIGIYKGYAVAWFGVEGDPDKSVNVCKTKEPKALLERILPTNEKEKTSTKAGQEVRYYLIISSVKDKNQAKKEVETLKAKGFKNPSVVASETNYRISLGNYSTREQALEAKNKLGERYKAAWILKQ